MEDFNYTEFLEEVQGIDYDKVEALIEKYHDIIDINKTDNEGNNALMNALGYGSYGMAEILVKNFKDSIDVNQINIQNGKTALLLEIEYLCEDLGISENAFKILIENFKDTININQADNEGDTALIYACSCGYIKLVKFLIENFKDSIDINQVNNEGNNAFMLACFFDENSIYAEPHLEIVKILIENFRESINIYQVNEDGNNALMLACDFEDDYDDNKHHKNIIKLIMENYSKVININQTNKKGQNALNVAVENDNGDMAKFLMKNYGHLINIDKKNIDDESILPCALIEHVKSEEYKKKEFESIDTIFVKIGDVVHCYKKDNSDKYDIKDKKQLLLNVDTGYGRYMKTDDEGVKVYRYHNRTDTILYS